MLVKLSLLLSLLLTSGPALGEKAHSRGLRPWRHDSSVTVPAVTEEGQVTNRLRESSDDEDPYESRSRSLRAVDLAASCNQQISCLELLVTGIDVDRYRMCLSWRPDLVGCLKEPESTFYTACATSDEADLIRNWESGQSNAMCRLVRCGEVAEYGINDGKKCKVKKGLQGQLPSGSYSEDVRCYAGGYCGTKRDKSCRWTVAAPQCRDGSTSLSVKPSN
mmetsp:Transcript_42655/g.78862  ORF Transcript_42655/g.78862 Transcript_42655/m.78862 type:complete len:220 (-) Transcript_42655:1035-1694(-)|eukprot:CAMPEP_0197433128 /NCGR_PEP_ID=MMETSP1175-20131217/1055_1 /TAXON_ID=1003142 /ORGANISM="Triceratium dubium, Strain CCMP147" /LENGTH=219 /DNA_ID=CAMNT_0042961409 /DNA_START=260 /DNA_END=919 /DNA_ORIENTATION=-